MTYRGARALITGGLGFIGSTLAHRLVSEGAEVTLVDSLEPNFGGNRFNVHGIEDRVSIRVADIRNKEVLEELVVGQQFLFNLAAQTSHVGSMQQPFLDLQINAEAQLSIVEACRHLNPKIKIVYASTRQLYGKPRYLPVDESHPIRPVDVNGVSKLAGEQFHLLYNDVYGIRACVVRLTNVFGPRMRIKDARQTFVGYWVRCLLERRNVPVYGDGRQLRDMLYVDDCVDALLVAGLNDAVDGGVFNIGGTEPIALVDLARMMTELGLGGNVELVPFPGERKAIDIGDYYSDSALYERVTAWSPRIDLREGLRRTVEFYGTRSDRYL